MSLVMATRASLKANPFLWSKRSTDEDIFFNHRCFKSVEFKGGSNFGGFKMNSFRVNSCSTCHNYEMEELVKSIDSSDKHTTIVVKCSAPFTKLDREKAILDGSKFTLTVGCVILVLYWVAVWIRKFQDLVNKWKKISVIKIQVGLSVTKQSLERELNQIAKAEDKSGSSSRKSTLNGIIKVLNQHCNDWISGYSCVDMIHQHDVKDFLKKNSHEERFKFTKETLLDPNKMEKESMSASQRHEVYRSRNNYMMVTMLVAVEGKHKMHSINNSRDLNQAFEKLQSLEIKEINVLWIPQKADQILSLEQLEKQYPLLKPFKTTGYHQNQIVSYRF